MIDRYTVAAARTLSGLFCRLQARSGGDVYLKISLVAGIEPYSGGACVHMDGDGGFIPVYVADTPESVMAKVAATLALNVQQAEEADFGIDTRGNGEGLH